MSKKEIILPENIADLRYVEFPQRELIEKAKEDMKAKVLLKVQRNPFIPLGMITTTIVLGLGIRQFVKRNSVMQQKYMRARIAVQFATFVFFVAGGAYWEWKDKKND